MIRPAPFRPSEHVLGTLSQTHRRVGIVPSSDASLRYVLPIPRTWGRVCGLAATPAAGRSELLGIFAPTPDLSGPRIIISVTRLRWDVDPIAWVRHRWETAGWSVAVARPLHSRWHPRFEVGALRCTEGEVEVRRCTGFIDNGRLLQVEVVAPSSQWPELHDLLWPCGVLLSLQNPTFRREVEAQKRIGNPRVRFGLPASWVSKVIAPARAETCRWVASPQDGGEHSVALRIDVSPWPRDGIEPVASRQARVRRELWAQGVALAGRIKRIPAGLATGAAGLMGLFSAKARDREERFEIRFAHRDGDGLSVDYTMAIASPERHPLDHMRAMRALEIVIASTEIHPAQGDHHAA